MLIFVDGFSHYTQAFMGDKWDVVQHGGNGSANTCGMTQSVNSGGRSGGGAAIFTDANDGSNIRYQYMQKNFSGVGTIVCGFALQQTGTQNAWQAPRGGGRLITFMSGNTVQCALTLLQSGQLEAIRNNNIGGGFSFLTDTAVPNGQGVSLGMSTDAIASSSFDFLEFKVTCDAVVGEIEVLRNGSPFWTLSNVNTNIAGTGTISSIIIGGYHESIGGGITKYGLKANITDVHILNTTVNGSDANDPVDFIGDRHWEVVLPSSDETYTDWTPFPSANHWENVDEIPPDEATSYNATETVGDKDSFGMTSFTGPASAAVLISYTMYLEKDTGGAVGVSGLMRSPAGGGGTDGNGTEFQVPAPFGFRQSFLCTDPDSMGPITVAIADAAEHGYERSS